jgi:uncharacterized membrane protein YdjX (TVP38/TMEM64 family)
MSILETRDAEEAIAAEQLRPRDFLKPLLVILVFAVGLTVVYFSPLKSYLRHLDEVRDRLDRMGPAAPLIFVAGVWLLICMGVPRLIFCPLGGMAFGFWRGLLWVEIGTLMGYYVVFLFVRWGGREFVLRRWPKVGRMRHIFHRRAIPTILVMRQLPISGLLINMLLGLSPIRHADFVLGTALGLLPEAIPLTLVGSSATHLSRGAGLLYVLAGLGFVLLIWIGFGLFVRFSKRFSELGDREASE